MRGLRKKTSVRAWRSSKSAKTSDTNQSKIGREEKNMTDALERKHYKYDQRKDCYRLGGNHDKRVSTCGWLICVHCGYRNPKDF